MEKDVRLRLLIDAVNRAGKSLQDTKRQLNEITGATKRASGAGTELGAKGAAGANKFANALRKVKEGMEKASVAADKLVNAGMQIGIMGAALSAAAFFPVKAAADFERAMKGVLAVTEGAGDQFEEITAKAAELGRTTKFTAKEAAEGMKFLGMAGFNASEVISAIGPALNLAAAGGMELAEAADIASNILSAFRLEVTDLTHVTDILANTAMSSNTSVQQLAEAMKYAAPVAAAAGISLEETAAVIGVLGNNGIQASMAGTTVRGMLASLAAPSKKAQNALDKLGVQVSKNEDGSINLTKSLKDMHDAHMSLADANAIFRRMAAAGALAVSGQTEAVEKLNHTNEIGVDVAKEMAETLEDNLIGAITLLTSAWDGLMTAMGTPLLASLKSIVEAVTWVISVMAEWANQYPIISGMLTALVGTLGVLLAALGVLFVAVGFTVKAFIALGTSWITLITRGPAVIASIGGVTTALRAQAAAALGAGVAMKAAVGLVAVWTAFKLVELSVEIYKSVKAWKVARAESAKMTAQALKFKDSADVQIRAMEEIGAMTDDQAQAYRKSLVDGLKYWQGLAAAAIRTGTVNKEAEKKVKAIYGALKLVGTEGVEHVEKVIDSSQRINDGLDSSQKAFDAFAAAAKKGYEEASAAADKFAEKALAMQEKIANLNISTEDKIRNASRKTMDDKTAWLDKQSQAEEKLAAARAAQAAGDYALAEKLAKQAESLYGSLAVEVSKTVETEEKVAKTRKKGQTQAEAGYKTVEKSIKEVQVTEKAGVDAAISGYNAVREVLTSVYTEQKTAAETASAEWTATAADIKQALDEAMADRALALDINYEAAVADTTQALEDLFRDREMTVTIKKVEKDALGGPAGGVYGGGGSLPGWGGGDKINALLEAGEWVIRKEAVKKYGSGFFSALNSMSLPDIGGALARQLGGAINGLNVPRTAYATGGSVVDPKNLGRIELAVGNTAFPVMGQVDVLEELTSALKKEKLARAN